MAQSDIGVLDLTKLTKEQIISFLGAQWPIRKKKTGNNKCPLYVMTDQGQFFINKASGQEFLLDHGQLYSPCDPPTQESDNPCEEVQTESPAVVEAAAGEVEPKPESPPEPEKKSFWEKPLIGGKHD